MTTGTDRTPVVEVMAVPGSRLEELLASYESAKADSEAAVQRFEAITAAIKAELSAAVPDTPEIGLSGKPGLPRLKLSWIRPWRFDSKRLKEEDPLTYVRYAVQGGHWELRQQ